MSAAERSEATRARLLETARRLFAERGYAGVGTEELVKQAGVTRGALYHHFRDKKDLFRAVYSATEREIVEQLAREMEATGDPWDFLVTGFRRFLDICTDPAHMRIGLLDAPAVLGWQEWRAIGAEYGLGVLIAGLQAAMDAGVLRKADVGPLAHLLFGTLGEAGMLIANSDDPEAARREVEATLLAMLDGLRA